jgi:hypothetical protein
MQANENWKLFRGASSKGGTLRERHVTLPSHALNIEEQESGEGGFN